MKIGILSDIHDNREHLRRAHAIFRTQEVELVIFTGDLVSPFTLKEFASWKMPIKAVFGNNEGDKWGIKRRLQKYQLDHLEYGPKSGLFHEIETPEGKIAAFHGHIPKFTALLISSQEYLLVCTGHTHEPLIEKHGKTTWINPGSVTGISEDDAVQTGSIATFDTTTTHGELIHLTDEETE